MKLNFNLYILFITICIGMVFPFSNKTSFHYQAILHFITGIFMYLMLNTKQNNDHKFAQNKQQSSKKITEDELQCLQDEVCKKHAATEKECNIYSRCKWVQGTGTCEKRTKCEKLDPYDCARSDYCDFNVDGKGACTFKTNITGKILNEDAKANRYCFKKNPRYIHDDPKGEFVEDQEYLDCIATETKSLEDCKKEAVNRLSCNTVKGLKYEAGICRKDKLYNISSIKKTNPKCLKVAQHSHDNPNQDGYIPHVSGRIPYIFKINDDQKLRFILNSFIILFIILLNVGIIKLFKN